MPGLPVPVGPTAPPPLLVPVPLPVAPLAVDPADGLLPVSLPLVPVALHAARDRVTMLPMRMPRTMFMIVSS